MRKLLLLLLFVLLGAFVLIFAINKGGEKYAVVEEKEIKRLVYGSGYARSKDYVLLKAEVSGYIKEVLVEEGDYVKRGQVLALMDSGPLEESIKEVSERLRLARERSREDSPYLKSLEKALESAKVSMENSQKVFERRERLFLQGLIPKEAYEQSKTQYEIAKREYERAKNAYEDAIRSINTEKRVLEADLKRLLKEKEKYVIRSPIEGYVLKKYVSKGDYINHISQDNKLFSIGSRDWEVWLEVDEEYAGLVKEGQRVALKLDAYPDRTFEGKVAKIIREVDRSRKLITVKVFADLPKETPFGATVDGQIEVENKKVLLIPAIAYRDGYVLVYDGIRKIKVPVEVGERFGEYIEVKSGLRPGQRVVLP